MIDRTNEFVSLLAVLFLSPALDPSSSRVSCETHDHLTAAAGTHQAGGTRLFTAVAGGITDNRYKLKIGRFWLGVRRSLLTMRTADNRSGCPESLHSRHC